MRTVVLLTAAMFSVMACAKSETPATDTPSMAAASEADVAGTWSGVSMMEGTDSVAARWTQVCGGGSCKGTVEGSADTIMSTYRIEGDSVIGMSSAYMEPNLKVNVIDAWMARPKDGKVTGTQVTKLADKDSVVARTRFDGTRAPQ